MVPGYELGQCSGSYPNLGRVLHGVPERDKGVVAEADLMPHPFVQAVNPHRKISAVGGLSP